MEDLNTGDKGATTPPPTEEERHTETVNDEVQSNGGPEPESKDDGPDVSARLDAIEKELAALKAMMDTLGYDEPTPTGVDDDGVRNDESIEDLFN
ncbi:hypothetical protein BD811P1_00013 [Bifidobacterium phage BD811P1]|nr:hypothetical protein BD811P1_00013 [Bifidobacterium phage BD811P1]